MFHRRQLAASDFKGDKPAIFNAASGVFRFATVPWCYLFKISIINFTRMKSALILSIGWPMLCSFLFAAIAKGQSQQE
jgi:hypothetical protein